MKGKLIVIDGSDGSGKQTQTIAICQRLNDSGVDAKLVTFPDYDSPSSALVKMYLAGEFGEIGNTNIYAVSAMYALDRYASFNKNWKKYYDDGYWIIADRYTTSNMIYQTVNCDGIGDKEVFVKWLKDFEYRTLGLPIPDKVIYLDVPPEVSFKLREKRENKITGSSIKDMHEKNDAFMKKVYYNAKQIIHMEEWTTIDCLNDKGEMDSIININDKIWRVIK